MPRYEVEPGICIYAEDFGDGPAIFFTSAGIQTRKMWEHQAAELGVAHSTSMSRSAIFAASLTCSMWHRPFSSVMVLVVMSRCWQHTGGPTWYRGWRWSAAHPGIPVTSTTKAAFQKTSRDGGTRKRQTGARTLRRPMRNFTNSSCFTKTQDRLLVIRCSSKRWTGRYTSSSNTRLRDPRPTR